MIDTYNLTERIMKSETPKDGEAILIEALKEWNIEHPNLLQKKGKQK